MQMPTHHRTSEQMESVHKLLSSSLRNYSFDYENVIKPLGTRVLLGMLRERCETPD
jgi:hypothetical protein